MSLGKNILLSILGLLLIFGFALLVWLSAEQKRTIEGQLLREAQGIYHYIVLTRLWVSEHGGVYVEEENGYRRFTPSDVVENLAREAENGFPVTFRMAVAGSANPRHVPNAFEDRAIDFLRRGDREVWEMERTETDVTFRYAGPLVFDNECVRCHAESEQRFRVAPSPEVLGCISVSIPADGPFAELARTRREYTLYCLAALGVLAVLLYGMVRSHVLVPLRALSEVSQRIRSGDYTVRVSVRKGPEWRELGESFNEMLDAIADRRQSLEGEVERTVTDLKKAYQELSEISRYRSEFFAHVTHDLKTPITAIKGAVEVLGKKTGGEGGEYLDIIQRNASKLSKMVQDLLDSSRIESKGLELDLEERDLAEVVEDAILMVTPLAWEKKIAIRYDVPHEPHVFPIDSQRMEQAVSNLLSNAIKFSPAGSEVWVQLESSGSETIVSVEDFGSGIPESERELVFQKFFRRSGEKASEGIGLGLAIAKGIIEAHGGRIWISDPDHPGTVFHFALKRKDT